ncbi:MAG TPA: hypothetical protein VK875_08100 [Euzebyales bacterium]|nr:hypothetical protein [Euzebyales bacterium]
MPASTAAPGFARFWWLVVLRSFMGFALGSAVLLGGHVRPALGNFIAMYWLSGAVLTLRWALAHRPERGSRLALFAGSVGTLASMLVLFRSRVSGVLRAGVVIDLLGATAVLTGLFRLSGVIHDDQLAGDRPRLRYRLSLGLLELGLGVALLVARIGGPVTAVAAGAWAIAGGVLLLLDGLALRRRWGTSARRR